MISQLPVAAAMPATWFHVSLPWWTLPSGVISQTDVLYKLAWSWYFIKATEKELAQPTFNADILLWTEEGWRKKSQVKTEAEIRVVNWATYKATRREKSKERFFPEPFRVARVTPALRSSFCSLNLLSPWWVFKAALDNKYSGIWGTLECDRTSLRRNSEAFIQHNLWWLKASAKFQTTISSLRTFGQIVPVFFIDKARLIPFGRVAMKAKSDIVYSSLRTVTAT